MKLNAIVKNRLFYYPKQAALLFNENSKNRFLYASGLLSFAMIGLLPLNASGQCTPNNIKHVSVLKEIDGCKQNVQIDLDGDGNFDVHLETNEQEIILRGSKGSRLSFAETEDLNALSFSGISNIQYGVALPGVYDFSHSDYSYILSSKEGLGGFAPTENRTPITGYIGFRMDNKYGFLELSISKLDDTEGASSCIDIGDFGVALVQNHSIETGVCASLEARSLEMKAQAEDAVILLAWESPNELQNTGFELERSLDKEAFEKIVWMPVQSTSNNIKQYKYEDKDIEPERTYFYRLKQMNEDGTNIYSDIASATANSFVPRNEVEAFPNPAQEYIQMRIKALTATNATIALFDQATTLVHSIERVPLREGINNMGLSVLELSAGTYILKIELDDEILYKRIVVL